MDDINKWLWLHRTYGIIQYRYRYNAGNIHCSSLYRRCQLRAQPHCCLHLKCLHWVHHSHSRRCRVAAWRVVLCPCGYGFMNAGRSTHYACCMHFGAHGAAPHKTNSPCLLQLQAAQPQKRTTWVLVCAPLVCPLLYTLHAYSTTRAAAQPPLHASATTQAPAAGAAHLHYRHYNAQYYRATLKDIKPNARVPWAQTNQLAKSLLLNINNSTIFRLSPISMPSWLL
jgi:hypothetical protein